MILLRAAALAAQSMQPAHGHGSSSSPLEARRLCGDELALRRLGGEGGGYDAVRGAGPTRLGGGVLKKRWVAIGWRIYGSYEWFARLHGGSSLCCNCKSIMAHVHVDSSPSRSLAMAYK